MSKSVESLDEVVRQAYATGILEGRLAERNKIVRKLIRAGVLKEQMLCVCSIEEYEKALTDTQGA